MHSATKALTPGTPFQWSSGWRAAGLRATKSARRLGYANRLGGPERAKSLFVKSLSLLKSASTNPEVVPGQYVVLCVTDTGIGMDAETIRQAFEPFFTKMYLPRWTGEVAALEDPALGRAPEADASETILVVEDDDEVRTYSVESLRELGYRVLESLDGASALRLLERQQRVDLLFTNVRHPCFVGPTRRRCADPEPRGHCRDGCDFRWIDRATNL